MTGPPPSTRWKRHATNAAGKEGSDPESIRARLCQLSEGRTTRQLAELTGIQDETVRRQLLGLTRPSIDLIAAFATAMDVSCDWILLGRKSTAPKPPKPAKLQLAQR